MGLYTSAGSLFENDPTLKNKLDNYKITQNNQKLYKQYAESAEAGYEMF